MTKPISLSGKAVAAALGLATLMLAVAPAQAFFYRRGPLNPLPPHAIGDIVRLDYGFRTIRSMTRDGPYYVVEGLDRRGLGARVVLDAYHGYLVDSTALRPPADMPQRLARIEPPQSPERGTARMMPVPPARPPLVRQGMPEVKPPAAQPPVAATAPASPLPANIVPRPVPRQSLIPDTGPAPSGTAPPAIRDTPASRAAPKLVNPQDVRPSGDPERTPPLARSAPGTMAPAALDDATPNPRGPATPAVPVMPLN